MENATIFNAIGAIATAVAALGTWAAIICAGFVLWRQNRKAKELTCLQLFLQLSTWYDSAEMNKRRARLATALLNNETGQIDDSVLVFFENVGLMVERGLLDIDLVDNVFGYDIKNYNSALEDYVQHVRKKFRDDTFYKYFDSLNLKVSEHTKRKYQISGSKVGVNQEAVKEFLVMEANREIK